MAKSGHAERQMKLDISVKDTLALSSGADVVIDWIETTRGGRDLKWDKWSTYYRVQFLPPARDKAVYPEKTLQTLLQDLLKDIRHKGLRSVAFRVDELRSWDVRSFVPLLLQAVSATGSDAKIFLCTLTSLCRQQTEDYLKSTEYQSLYNGHASSDKEVLPVKEITYEQLRFFEHGAIDKIYENRCRVRYESGNLVITGSKAYECKQIIKDAVRSVNDLFVEHTDTTYFNSQSLCDMIANIQASKKVYCAYDKKKPSLLHIYGKSRSSVTRVKQDIETRLAKPKQSPVNNSTPVGGNVGCGRGHTPRPDGKQTPVRNVKTFHTKENIEIRVYAGNIVQLNVDCIINAANTGLTHEAGLAEVIAKAAGKDLINQCKDFIKKNKKLKVGEAIKTSAGKLPCRYVVHTVGPCWNLYKPYTQESVAKCKEDLKSAILNSLKSVSYDPSIKSIACPSIKSIACPSISSGKFGVPRELCCVQYAEALIEYSKDTAFPVMQIHFVDTNPSMVQIMTETFDSMFNKGRPPQSYNEKVYVSQGSRSYSGQGATAGSHGKQPVAYPSYTYTKPPRHDKPEFTCVLGPNQNLYIYTGDILKVRKIDLIVCGDVPTGRSSGLVAKELWDTCGELYKKNKQEAFKGKSDGEVVFCSTMKYRFVAHVLLTPTNKLKTEVERRNRLDKIFHAIFDGMKNRSCRTMAIPLIGTGKGHGDPVFYAERFIQSLIEFCSFHKSFTFDIHLVNFDVHKAIETIRTEIEKQIKYVKNPPAGTSDRHQSNATHSKPNSTGCADKDNGRRPAHSNQKGRRPASASAASNYSLNDDKRHRDSASAVLKSSKYDSHSHNSKPQFSQSQRNHQSKPSYNRTSSVEETTQTKEPVRDVDLHKSKSVRTPSSRKQSSRNPWGNSSDSDPEIGSLKITDSTVKAAAVDPPKGNLPIFIDDEKLTNSDSLVKQSEPHSQDAVTTYSDDDDDDGAYKEDDYDDYYNGNSDDNFDDRSRPESHASGHEEMEVDNKEESVADVPENCVICMDTISKSNSKTLLCGHKFCADCIDQQFVYKEACPTCGFVCGIITGDQPEGDMYIKVNHHDRCIGYEDCSRIEITYTFPNGIQGSNHPEPGKRYRGIRRTAYLPHNKQGKQILEMLRIAFDRKLIFTIGRSRTTGADSVITWNDIHHKTDPKPNTQFGYPDPTYLDRVTDELKAKGVTENDIPSLSERTRRR